MKKILVVGQTPPPYHGQAMMINRLVKASFKKIKIYHIRMSYSENFKKIGRVNLKKITHLIELVIKTYYFRFKYGINTLYYPPAGPNRAPILRDIIFLFLIRPLFRETIFHFRAAGISEYLERSDIFLRYFAKMVYNKPRISIQLSNKNPADGNYFNSNKVLIIPNGIEDDNINPIEDEISEQINLLSIGVIQKSKGIEDLLEALNLLNKKNVFLNILGEFISKDYECFIKEKISNMKNSDNIFFHGTKINEEKNAFFKKSDVLCFPTFYESESFGNVLLEAMMFSLPVVATDWRGIPDIVIENTTGFLVPINSPIKIAEKLKILIENRELSKQMGKNGRKRYEEMYTIDKHLNNMEKMFCDEFDLHK